MAEPPRPLEAFPETAAGAGRAVARANAALAAASLDRLLVGGFGDVFLVWRARFDWRFYVALEGRRAVFFFARSASPTEVVLDATASFTLEPLTPGALPPPAGPLAYRWVVPSFVIPAPDPAQVRLWAPDAAPADKTVFLALGRSVERVLAVRLQTDAGAQFAYSEAGRKITFSSSDSRWPLQPVISLLQAIRAWTESESDQGTEVPLTPPERLDNAAVRILVALAQGWLGASRGGILGDGDVRPASPLVLAYGVDDLHARVVLRLTSDGDLASSDADDPFQLALQVRVGPHDGGVRAIATIRPPDFLAGGSLHEAFGRLVRSPEFVRALRSTFEDPAPPEEALADFLAASRSRWSVFRVARGRTHDTDVVVWEGTQAGRPFLLVLRADVVVDTSGTEPDVRLADRSRLRPLYWGPADAEEGPVLEDVVRYFVRLLSQVQRWIALVG